MGLVQAFCAQGVKTPEWDCAASSASPGVSSVVVTALQKKILIFLESLRKD